MTNILSLKDLEAVPWNVVLLFGGAMSIGFCLWQTGAAEWMAIGWLSLLHEAPWLVFIMGVTFFVLIMPNFIMNVAAIAITLPVALVMAPYVGVEPEVVMFASLAAGPQCHRVRKPPVPHSGIFPLRNSRQCDSARCHRIVRLEDLAVDGDAGPALRVNPLRLFLPEADPSTLRTEEPGWGTGAIR